MHQNQVRVRFASAHSYADGCISCWHWAVLVQLAQLNS